MCESPVATRASERKEIMSPSSLPCFVLVLLFFSRWPWGTIRAARAGQRHWHRTDTFLGILRAQQQRFERERGCFSISVRLLDVRATRNWSSVSCRKRP